MRKKSEFIKFNTKPGEKIIIVSENAGVYFLETGTITAFNLGMAEFFFKKDYERLKLLVEKENIKFFYELTNNKISENDLDIFKKFIIKKRSGNEDNAMILLEKI